MATVKLSFNKPYYNVAEAANTVALEEAYNVYFEAMPQGGYAIRKRPGYSQFQSHNEYLGQGFFWSDRQKALYYAVNGKLYTRSSPTNASTYIGLLNGAVSPVVFAEGQKLNLDLILYMASGGRVKYLDIPSNTLVIPSDANTPSSTFIANMNNRFYANDVNHDQDFLITDFNPDPAVEALDVTYWSSAVNPFRASQKPDPLLGIYTGWNEMYLWGSQACEVWQEDGVTPVSPLVGSIIEGGCAAPYSVVISNNTLYGLGTVQGKRAVMRIVGRSPQIISEPIANRLQAIEKVDDAIGSLCFVGGMNLYVLSFPSAQQTWVFDFKSETWSQWSSWDLGTGSHKMYRGRFNVYAKDWNKHLTMTDAGNIYELSRDIYDDAGTPMRSSVRTGWIDHGTWDRKRADQLMIKLQGYAPSTARILLRWRTDGFPEWSTAVELNIQSNSQNDHFVKLNRMGMYRSRQYEFIMTDAQNLALIGMEEDVIKMRY